MLTIRYSEFSSIIGPSSCFFFFFQQGTDMLYCCFRYLFSRKTNQSCFRLFRPLKNQNTTVACKYKYLGSLVHGGMKMIGGIHLINSIGLYILRSNRGQLTRDRAFSAYVSPSKKSGIPAVTMYLCPS